MKVRWISLGVAIGLGLALTVGFAFASDRSTPDVTGGRGGAAVTQTDGWAAMEAMHDSPAMQRLHAQMEQMMGAGGMMDGDMSAHHSGMTGGGMMGAGSGNPGGMMGQGSGSMMGR